MPECVFCGSPNGNRIGNKGICYSCSKEFAKEMLREMDKKRLFDELIDTNTFMFERFIDEEIDRKLR